MASAGSKSPGFVDQLPEDDDFSLGSSPTSGSDTSRSQLSPSSISGNGLCGKGLNYRGESEKSPLETRKYFTQSAREGSDRVPPTLRSSPGERKDRKGDRAGHPYARSMVFDIAIERGLISDQVCASLFHVSSFPFLVF